MPFEDACPWPFEPPECCPAWDNATPEQRERAVRLATDFLWAASGRQFGVCEVTVRPCGLSCPCTAGPCHLRPNGLSGFPWQPHILASGDWSNATCTECRCCAPCEVDLPGPVVSITSVSIDGEVLSPLTPGTPAVPAVPPVYGVVVDTTDDIGQNLHFNWFGTDTTVCLSDLPVAFSNNLDQQPGGPPFCYQSPAPASGQSISLALGCQQFTVTAPTESGPIGFSSSSGTFVLPDAVLTVGGPFVTSEWDEHYRAKIRVVAGDPQTIAGGQINYEAGTTTTYEVCYDFEDTSVIVVPGTPEIPAVPGAPRYRVDNMRFLVRQDGECFPECNDYSKGTGPGVFEVTYMMGTEVPYGGEVAAGELACSLIKVCPDGINCGSCDDVAATNTVVTQWLALVNPRSVASFGELIVPGQRSTTSRTTTWPS